MLAKLLMQFGENHMLYNNVRAKIAWPAFLTVNSICARQVVTSPPRIL